MATSTPVTTILPERRALLVSGLHKTGTTWTQSLLDAHPEIACRTEDSFVSLYELLKSAVTAYNARIADEDERRARQGTTPFDENDLLSLCHFAIRRALAKAPDHLRWSGIKDNVLNTRAFLLKIPNSVVVSVIRDPRDTAISSWASIRRNAGLAEARVERPPLDHVDKILDAAGVNIGEVEARLAEFPGRVHVVRYEDLSTDFAGTVRDLLAFLGVARDEATIAALGSATDFATLSGGRRVGDEDARSFYRRSAPGGWRDHFTPADLAPRLERHRAWMSRWGYAVDG